MLEVQCEAARSAGLDLAQTRNSLSSRGSWRQSILKQERELADKLASGDADGLAVFLVEHFHMGSLEPDGQQRAVGVLSAILAPAVMLEAHALARLTPARLRLELLEWVEAGTTESAAHCATVRRLRAFAGHPASIYNLIGDASEQSGLDQARLIEMMVKPVLLALSTFEGLLSNVRGAVPEPASR